MPDPAKIWEAIPCPDIGRPSKFTCTTTIHGKSREPLLPFVNLHNLSDRLRPRIWYIDISPLLKAQDVACLGARYLGLMMPVSVEQAAKLAGIGRDLMYEYVRSRADPIPQMRVGRSKTLIRTSAIPEYMRRRETV